MNLFLCGADPSIIGGNYVAIWFDMFKFFAAAPKGFEFPLAQELTHLGAQEIKESVAGVTVAHAGGTAVAGGNGGDVAVAAPVAADVTDADPAVAICDGGGAAVACGPGGRCLHTLLAPWTAR